MVAKPYTHEVCDDSNNIAPEACLNSRLFRYADRGPQHVQDLVRTPSGCEKVGCAEVVVVLKAGADGWCGWLAKRRTASREAQ